MRHTACRALLLQRVTPCPIRKLNVADGFKRHAGAPAGMVTDVGWILNWLRPGGLSLQGTSLLRHDTPCRGLISLISDLLSKITATFASLPVMVICMLPINSSA